MPWHTKLGTTYTEMTLTQEEIDDNILMIWGFFGVKGWTVNAVAGLIGFLSMESGYNPGTREVPVSDNPGHDGRGLVQWTTDWTATENPLHQALDAKYGNHDEWSSGDKQCNALWCEWETYCGIHDWGIDKEWYENFPSVAPENRLTWQQWAASTASPDYLAIVILECYGRGGYGGLYREERKANALAAYQKIKDVTPTYDGQSGTIIGGGGSSIKYLFRQGNHMISDSGIMFYHNSSDCWVAARSSGSAGGVVSGSELQNKVANEMLTFDGKNVHYSNDLRWHNYTPYDDGQYYGDCSSLIVEIYRKIALLEIGTYTWDMDMQGQAKVVDDAAGGCDTSKLAPGDVLFYGGSGIGSIGAAPDTSQTGHVEMYIGNGICMGHGSDTPSALSPNATGAHKHQAASYTPAAGENYAGAVRYVNI